MAQRKGKATGTKVKTIEQYCSVCKKTFDMPVVEEADNHEVIWLKCPECEGFLPYMTGQNDDAHGEGGSVLAESGVFVAVARLTLKRLLDVRTRAIPLFGGEHL